MTKLAAQKFWYVFMMLIIDFFHSILLKVTNLCCFFIIILTVFVLILHPKVGFYNMLRSTNKGVQPKFLWGSCAPNNPLATSLPGIHVTICPSPLQYVWIVHRNLVAVMPGSRHIMFELIFGRITITINIAGCD